MSTSIRTTTIKFFVSSTFKDMDLERDLLKNVVANRLNEYYKERGVIVEFVDLRYSVTTDSSISPEGRECQIFDYCMGEIDECAPYFIGLIGHRYGWTPDHKTAAQKKEIEDQVTENFVMGIDDMSVTFIEFLRGAVGKLNDNRKGKLFYLRSEESYDDLSVDERNDFIEDNEENTAKNSTLREYIKSFDNKRGISVKDYTLNPCTNNQLDVENWCNMIIRDICDIINERFSNINNADPFYVANEKFVTDHIRRFKGRKNLLDDIGIRYEDGNYYLQTCNRHIIISGEPGSGKSALLCKIYDLIRQNEKNIALFASREATPDVSDLSVIVKKWATQIVSKTGIDMPEQFAKNVQLSDTEIGLIYNNLVAQATDRGYEVIHFMDNYYDVDIIDNDLFFVLVQNHIYNHMKNMVLDTSLLDDESISEIAEQLRPSVRDKLILHSSSSNVSWLSFAVHILENQTRSHQKAMRKGFNGLYGEEGITAYLCHIVDCLPSDFNSLREYWLSQLCEIYGEQFVAKYIKCLTLGRGGWSDNFLSIMTDTSPSWCISFRQSASQNIIELNRNGLYSLSYSGDIYRKLIKREEGSLKSSAEKAWSYLDKLPDGTQERRNLFNVLLYLNNPSQLLSYFTKKDFFPTPVYDGLEYYCWNNFVKNHPFDAQKILSGVLDIIPAKLNYWNNLILWQNGLNTSMIFKFMLIIERKANEHISKGCDLEFNRIMKDIYLLSINSAPDSSSKKIELRKFLKFYTELFEKDASWREEYISAVCKNEYYLTASEKGDFLMYNYKLLQKKNALDFISGEPTREFAKFYHILYLRYNNITFALKSCKLFENALHTILSTEESFETTTKALNCYHELMPDLIKYSKSDYKNEILESLTGFVNIIDNIVEKFNGFGPPVDDDLLDECRAIYFFCRCTLIASYNILPTEKLNKLAELHQICMNFVHHDCKPREEDLTMLNSGHIGLTFLVPEAPAWMTLAHIMICLEAADLILRNSLAEGQCGEFYGFDSCVHLSCRYIEFKDIYFPINHPILKNILNQLKFRYIFIFYNGFELLDKNTRISIRNEWWNESIEILKQFINIDPRIDRKDYEYLLRSGNAKKILEIWSTTNPISFIDLYYLGVAYINEDLPQKAENVFDKIFIFYREIADQGLLFASLCNLLATYLKSHNFDNFKELYDNLWDEEKEYCYIKNLYNLYKSFEDHKINSAELKKSIQGFMLE